MSADTSQTQVGQATKLEQRGAQVELEQVGNNRKFRTDIEGLRALAVILVVLGHSGVTQIGGGYVGVDVFFVISGFLITSILLRELSNTGRLSIAGFYARRALRLLPVSTLVLICSLIGAWVWLPPIRMGDFAHDAFAAVTYWANLRFSLTGTDYLAADVTPSPFQHFWSLAVEEQFYIVWPCLIILASIVCRKIRRFQFPVLLACILAILAAASLYCSFVETQRSAPWAYFGTHTRAWELSIGASLALVAPRLSRLPRRASVPLGWMGLALIAGSAISFRSESAYPGLLAVIPVAGTAAVVTSGAGAMSRFGVGVVLDRRIMQWVGRLSYGWYLWHWPILLILPTALGVPGNVLLNFLLCLGALGLSWITYHSIEDPVRNLVFLRSTPGRGISLGVVLASVVTVVALLSGTSPRGFPVGPAADDLQARLSDARDPEQELRRAVESSQFAADLPANLDPGLANASADKPVVYLDGCHADIASTDVPAACVYGDLESATTMVLFGDSHAAQWFPALQLVAVERHWRLVSLTKSGCTAANVSIWLPSLKRDYRECQEWRRTMISYIRQLSPSLIVVASSFEHRSTGGDTPSTWATGWKQTFDDLLGGGAKVVALSDTPHMAEQVPSCLSIWSQEIYRCHRRTADSLSRMNQDAAFSKYAKLAGAKLIDPKLWLCSDVCPPVLKNILVYRDSNHLSTACVRALTPVLSSRIPRLPIE